MNKNKITQLVAVFALVALAMVLTFQALPAHATDPSPQTISGTPASLSFVAGNGVTASVSTTAQALGNYGVQDCYAYLDVTSSQTVTAIIQHAFASGNWVNGSTILNATTADTVTFVQLPVYGNYQRVAFTLGGSNPVTASVQCKLKNNGG